MILIKSLLEEIVQTSLSNNTYRIWNVAVYVRISETERDKSESDSISNQKRYIQKFIDKDNALILIYIRCILMMAQVVAILTDLLLII